MRVIVHAPVAPLFYESRPSSTQISQLLRGHSAEFIGEQGDWLRVRGNDGYEGWLHRGYVHDDDGWKGTRISLECRVRGKDNYLLNLPLGALLSDDEIIEDGRAVSPEDQAHVFPKNAEAILQTALERFEGTYYQWGGITPWGADCSGLVQTVFGLHGIKLPRDAWQQAREGIQIVGVDRAREFFAERNERELAKTPSLYQPGDLLFFGDNAERITHVAISTGGTEVVHMSLNTGGYSINDLAGDEPVDCSLKERFLFARRIL